LNEVSNAVAAKMNPPMGAGGPTPAPGTARPRVGGGPTVDGRTITLRSFYDVAPELSKNIPILFGSVSEEGNSMSSRPTESPVVRHLYEELRRRAKRWREALVKAHPEKSIGTLSYMCGGAGLNSLALRNKVTHMATMNHGQKRASAYAWYFTADRDQRILHGPDFEHHHGEGRQVQCQILGVGNRPRYGSDHVWTFQ